MSMCILSPNSDNNGKLRVYGYQNGLSLIHLSDTYILSCNEHSSKQITCVEYRCAVFCIIYKYSFKTYFGANERFEEYLFF